MPPKIRPRAGGERTPRRARPGRRADRAARDDPAARLALIGAAVPWPDRPRTAAPAVPARSAVVHALAGPARSPQPARRVAVGKRLVAGDERAFAARRMGSDCACWRRPGDPSSHGCSAVAAVRSHSDTVMLVPRSQRQHRGRLPGARRACRGETAPERFFMNVALARVLYAHALVAAPRLALGDSLLSPASSAIPGSESRARSSRSAA